MKSYKELSVWQRSIELVICIYKISAKFPADERYCLTNQIHRSAISIPANIAEGWGRNSRKEYVQFLIVSRGSAFELQTHTEIAHRLGFLSTEKYVMLNNEIDEITKMLNGLIRSIRNK